MAPETRPGEVFSTSKCRSCHGLLIIYLYNVYLLFELFIMPFNVLSKMGIVGGLILNSNSFLYQRRSG